MATRTVKRSTGVEPISARFAQYLMLNKNSSDLTTRANMLKKDLGAHADQHGEVDPEKGHKVFLLPAPVEVAGKRYLGFMRQRRVSQTFNEEAAQALCEERGFSKDEYITVQEYVDQDKVARLWADDRLSDEDMKSLLTENETWAFVPVKED